MHPSTAVKPKKKKIPSVTQSTADRHTDLAVAVASELRDEAHVIVADLKHLLADVVLRAAGNGRARPPAGSDRQQPDSRY